MAPQNPRDMRDYMSTIERIAKQQRAMPALISSIVSEGKEEEAEEKVRHPAPPVELVAQSGYYTDPALRRQRVRLILDFPDVIFNTDGTTASIAQYELWGRDETDLAEDTFLDDVPWVRQSTSEISAFRAEGYIPGRTWRFRVRALGTDSILPGDWSEEIVVRMVRDTTPPPQAAAPVAVASRGVITVTWSGQAVTGPMPADFEYAILAHGSASSPTKEVHRFGAEDGFTVIAGIPYNKVQYFRVRAVDESGNLGPWSEQATAVTKPLVDVDVIISEIDAGKTIISNAEKLLLSSGAELGKKLQDADSALAETEKKLTGPGGLTERLAGAEQKLSNVGALTMADGTTLNKKLADNASAITTAQGQLTTLRDTTLPALNSSLAGATGRLTAAEGQITAASSALSTAKTDIAAAAKDISANKLVMDGAVTRLGAAEGEITSAKGRLTAAEGKVTTLQNTTIPALNSALESAGSRLDASDKLVKETFPAQLSALERQSAATDALIAQALASGQSLIVNGNFEAGMTGWKPTINVEVLAAAARSGTGGMRLTPRGGNLWPANQEIATSTGRVYYAEMWVRRTGTDDAYAGTAIGFVPQSRNAAGTYATPSVRAKLDDGTLVRIADIPTDSFVRVSAEFTITQADANRVTFSPWFFRNDNGNFYDIDDMMVIDITEAKKVQAGLTAAEAEIVNAKKEITANKGVMDGAITRLGSAEGLLTDARTRLGAAEGKVTTLQNTTLPALNSALDGATGRLTTAEGKITKAEGALSTATSDLSKLTNRVSPLESGINTLTTTTIPALTSSINGKTTINRQTTVAANPGSYSLGDRWEKWSSLAAGGKLQQTWRHNGTAWVEEVLDASYLPLVDIGAGTFGTLSGGRLTVKSVSAAQMLIGFGENLLADPTFEDPEISTRRASSAANWSWVQDALGGSYMTTEWATTADLALGNSSVSELFPIDPTGAMAFTVDAEGPDVLQVYLQVRYADGTANTGPYVKSLPLGAGPGRRTATVQYDFAGPTLSSTGSPPVSARPILRRKTSTLTGVTKVYSVRFAPATKGEMVVNGTITGDHVAAESVAAKIGSFLSLTTDQLVAGSAVLGDAVAQKIAAATASFQKVDAKNLTVTGTSSLSEVVAKRLAAETGVFLSLTTDQLVAGSATINSLVAQKIAAATATFQKADISNLTAGTANMTQAVIDKLVANTASFQRVTVDNITATATASLNSVVAQRIAAGTASFQTVDVKNLFVTGTASMNEVVAKRIAAETGVFMSLTTDQLTAGAANINSLVAQKIAAGTAAFQKADISNLTAGTANMTQAVIDKLVANTASFQRVTVDNITATATANLNSVVAQRIAAGTASFQTVDVKNLFVTGTASMEEVVAKRIASETGAFIKLSVDQLTVAGTANMTTAVADRMFSNLFTTRRLTANQVYIGEGGNLFPAELDDPAWQRINSIQFLADGGKSGGASILIPGTATQNGTYFGTATADRLKMPKLIAGASYRIRAYVRSDAALPKFTASVYVRLYPTVGTAYTWAVGSAVSNPEAIPANTWGEVDGLITVPAGSTNLFAALGVYTQTTATGATRFSDLTVQEAITPELLVDGAVTARTITASEEMGAKLARFIKLEVTDLVTTGSAKINEAVITKLFTETFATNKLSASQVLIGMPNNILPDVGHNEPAMLAARNASSTMAVTLTNTNDYALTPHATSSTYFRPLGVAQNATAYKDWVAVKEGEVWRWGLDVVSMRAPGSIKFVGRTIDGQAYANPSGTTVVPVGSGHYEVEVKIPAGTAWICPEFTLPSVSAATTSGTTWIDQGSMYMYQAIDNALVVDGAITTKKLTVTEDMTVALLKAHKIKAGEIDTNSLAADTAFVGFMDAKLVRSDMFSGKVFSGGIFDGATFRTNSAAATVGGIQFDKSSIRAWSSSGVQTFSLSATTGKLVAVGDFETAAVAGVKIQLMTVQAATRLVPKLNFEFPGANVDPQIWTEFDQPGVVHNYGHGSLAMIGTQLTPTSGWSALNLNGDGQQVGLMQRGGQYDQVGFGTFKQYADIRGLMRSGSYANTMFRTGAVGGLSGNLGIGASTVYTINLVPAPAGTVIRPFVTVNNNGNPFATQTYDAWTTSFKVRIHNMGSGASNLFGLHYFATASD